MLKICKINNYMVDVFFPPHYAHETGFHRWVRWNVKNESVIKSSIRVTPAIIEQVREAVK